MVRRVFVDAEQERQFRRDGIVIARLLDEAEARALLDAYWSRASALDRYGFHASMFSRDLEYRRAVDADVKQALAARALRLLSDYRAVVGNYVVKEQGRDDSQVPVHQDWSFVPEPEMHSINVWCPLIDTTVENGRLQVFRGSHELFPILRGPFFPSPYVDLAPFIERHCLTELPLRAGEAAIYSHALVHASPPNRSAQPRVAANLTLVPREAELFHGWLDGGPRPELFRVEDEFFLRNIIGERPAGVPSLGQIGAPIPVVSEEELVRRIAAP
jgi:hypothetical protein